jgi:hypothetical protein
MPNLTQLRGTAQTLLSTEMNSLGNNANAVHATSVALTSAGYIDAEVEFVFSFPTAPTPNTSLWVWFLREVDGTNFEDGSGSVTPTRLPDLIYTVRAVNTTQRLVQVATDIPPGNIRALVRNQGTGQAMGTSNVLTIRPKTYQS